MADAAFDTSLAVLINKSARLSFVQGEDRLLQLLVQDQDAQGPLDLTGYSAVFGMPRAYGGSIRRLTGPLAASFAASSVLNGQSVFTLLAHGLVNGDQVTLSAPAGDTLPAPFVAATTYTVAVLGQDTFALTAEDGSKLALLAPSTLVANLQASDFTISRADMGELTLRLGQAVTTAAATGQGLSYQLTLFDSTGRCRVLVGHAQLDVAVQPCP